jgi:hypothetical protein
MFFINNEFTEESIYNIMIIVFISIGFLYLFKHRVIPPRYNLLVAFFTFKLIFDYRKCTFSYLECKMRKVKKEDGVLASFMDHVVDLRYTRYKYIMYIISVIFLLHTDELKEIFNYKNYINYKNYL